MDSRRITNSQPAIQQLLEADITRLQNELNYRLLMEDEWTDQVLWVGQITVTQVEYPGWGQEVRGKMKKRFRLSPGSWLALLRVFVNQLTAFKNKNNRKEV